MKLAIVTLTHEASEHAQCAFGYAVQFGKLIAQTNAIHVPTALVAAPYSVHYARSRAVRVCRELEVDYALHWDADVVPDDAGALVARLIATGKDLVGCVYPRKRIFWQRAERGGEAHAYEYPYRAVGPDGGTAEMRVVDGCIPIPHLPFGFMLMSRRCMDAMWARYEDELWYSDPDPATGVVHRGVYLFGELWTTERTGPDGRPYRHPLSEDYSFCERWCRMGQTPFMFVREGAPVSHVGGHLYRGHREGLIYGR